ncbi:unnamed protein product [Polarella glacialis]|uniref:phosphoserine phosphatase n=1 Tax=Polarella glacialis TaxID=89957 RepID=A0A813G9Y3_POLGL|nr:unnamed protein product [Polarella glacialis]
MECVAVPVRGPRQLRGTSCTVLLAAGFLFLAAPLLGLEGRTFFGRSPEDSKAKAQRILLSADAVCFDVDSTVVETEGIDLLAKCYNVEEAVKNLTRNAMEGNVKFQDALAARLDLMQPSRHSLEECLKTEGKPRFTAGVIEVVRRLHARGTHVFLVSGGFRVMIEPIAEELKVPQDRIFANTILFDEEGNYAGFDETEPTSRDGGKPAVLTQLKRKRGYKNMVMVGDGATDLQARPPAKVFIGFGGIQIREKVKQGADWFVYDFQEVLDVLPEA